MTKLKTVLRSTGLLLAVFWLAGCGKSPNADRTVYFYDLSETTATRSCMTQRTFGFKRSYCQALNDEALNGNCASAQRRQIFAEAGCEGTFSAQLTAQPTAPTAPPATPTTPEKPQVTIAYEFISFVNNRTECTTGLKSFGSQAETCFNILDDAANNNCARDQRQDYFDQYCR
jgi:hypothetical protein